MQEREQPNEKDKKEETHFVFYPNGQKEIQISGPFSQRVAEEVARDTHGKVIEQKKEVRETHEP